MISMYVYQLYFFPCGLHTNLMNASVLNLTLTDAVRMYLCQRAWSGLLAPALTAHHLLKRDLGKRPWTSLAADCQPWDSDLIHMTLLNRFSNDSNLNLAGFLKESICQCRKSP
jgi:hypothetical protein